MKVNTLTPEQAAKTNLDFGCRVGVLCLQNLDLRAGTGELHEEGRVMIFRAVKAKGARRAQWFLDATANV